MYHKFDIYKYIYREKEWEREREREVGAQSAGATEYTDCISAEG